MRFDDTKMLRFDGTNKSDFSYYKTRMLAMAKLNKGMDIAFKKQIEMDPKAQGYDKDEHELRDEAWSYLILSLDGPPLELVRVTPNEDPYAAWNLLKKKYEPTDVEAATAITQEMDLCEMEDFYGDPGPWITQLQTLNLRLTSMTGNYVRSDVQIISQVLNKLPKELYDPFIISIETQGYTQLSLDQFKRRLKNYWNRSVRGRSDHVTMYIDTAKQGPGSSTVAASSNSDIASQAMANYESQLKNLTEIIENMRMEQQKKDPAAWGVRICTLCGRAGHEAQTCRSGGQGGQGYYNYGQSQQPYQ
jgi:hypothetical protein